MNAVNETHESLPSGVRPKTYALHLRVDLDERAFKGNVLIEIDVKEPTAEIVLNALDLDISGVRITDAIGGNLRHAESVRMDAEKQRVTFTFAERVEPGISLLFAEFSGKLNDSMVGLYKSTYMHDGAEKIMAVSQFEAPHARRLFPCFDQPDMKAVVRVSMDVPVHCQAISNGEIMTARQAADPMRKIVTFEPTPPMSTYILTFIVGELERMEKVAKTGARLRVWTTPGKGEQGRFALDVADRVLSFFTDYFGVAYPLPKLDLIAVPDFSAGAMENWGAIVFREQCLLVGPDSSRATKQRVTEYIAHELAHMWFGNLVTMTWWDDLWLNESFATYYGNMVTDEISPEFDMWPQYSNDAYGGGMELDELESTHPIHMHVPTAEAIDEIFDAISYNKGGAVLRMCFEFVGEEYTREAIRAYMKRHAYGNTVAADLWGALEEASGEPIRSLMHAWTHAPGYPVLTVNSGRAAGNRGKYLVTQERFRHDRPDAASDAKEEPETCWPIPIIARTDNGTFYALMTEKCETIALPDAITEGATFVCMNADRAGFYRVRYDAPSLARMVAALEADMLETTERIAFEDDTFALCYAGMVPVTDYLKVAEAYAAETEYSVWSNLLAHLDELKRAFAGDRDTLHALDAFGRKLVADVVREVGWDPSEGESHSTTLLRSTVLRFAGDCGDPQVLAEAYARHEDACDDRDSVSADIRQTVYALAAANGDTLTFRSLLKLYHSAASAEEKVRLLRAIGAAGTLTLRNDALSFSMSDDVRPQDAPSVLAAVAGASQGDRIAWQFVTRKWDALAKRYEGNNMSLGYFITYGTETLYGAGDAEEVRKFFEKKKPAGLDRTVAQAIERVEKNAAWRARNEDGLREWSLAQARTAAAVATAESGG